MKVTVKARGVGKYDVRIQRTRRSEGRGKAVKGLSLVELREWLATETEIVAHPKLPKM